MAVMFVGLARTIMSGFIVALTGSYHFMSRLSPFLATNKSVPYDENILEEEAATSILPLYRACVEKRGLRELHISDSALRIISMSSEETHRSVIQACVLRGVSLDFILNSIDPFSAFRSWRSVNLNSKLLRS